MGVPARVQRTEEELVGCGGEGNVVLPHGGGKPALEENTAPPPLKKTHRRKSIGSKNIIYVQIADMDS